MSFFLQYIQLIIIIRVKRALYVLECLLMSYIKKILPVYQTSPTSPVVLIFLRIYNNLKKITYILTLISYLFIIIIFLFLQYLIYINLKYETDKMKQFEVIYFYSNLFNFVPSSININSKYHDLFRIIFIFSGMLF